MQIARTINYHVDIDEITPQGEQFGGMQGEHESTELVFHLTDLLIDVVYREDYSESIFCSLQATDGAGGYHEYELLLTQSSLSFLIPSSITRAGGIANFCLVFRETKTQNDEIINSKILYSFPFKLRFKDTLTVGTPSQEEFLEDGASILEGAKKYAQDALEYRNETENLITNANNVLSDLEGGIVEAQEEKAFLQTASINAITIAQTLKSANKQAEFNLSSLNSLNEEADENELALKELLGNTDTVLEELNNIEEALDTIIEIQNSLIGGNE